MSFIMRHSIALPLLLAGLATSPGARAAEVTLIGVFGDKAAILSIDGGPPRTVKVGQKLGDLTLASVTGDKAVVEIEGKRRTLLRGQTYSSAGAAAQSVTLSVGRGGHFMADGQINGAAVRFLVDTGASAVALPASEANRLRIDYRSGRRGTTQTAGGPMEMYVVRLASIRVGGIELQNIDAVVLERGLDVVLLGNTFLNRVEMRREGETMTLTRRF
ncbi:MAG: retroviral-like aspartic protease family protein [Candidatus Parcubacteria bacterium]|nr:retroviral-like aspartic protease family protein [Burkholderiales bacterium]